MKETLFDSALRDASDWVDTIAKDLGTSHTRSGYAALRATLHAVRDALQMTEAVQFGEKLPILIRGLYYEGWVPHEGSARVAQLTEFTDVLRHELRGHAELPEPGTTARITFGALRKLMPQQEVDAVASALPLDIRELCQAPAIP